MVVDETLDVGIHNVFQRISYPAVSKPDSHVRNEWTPLPFIMARQCLGVHPTTCQLAVRTSHRAPAASALALLRVPNQSLSLKLARVVSCDCPCQPFAKCKDILLAI